MQKHQHSNLIYFELGYKTKASTEKYHSESVGAALMWTDTQNVDPNVPKNQEVRTTSHFIFNFMLSTSVITRCILNLNQIHSFSVSLGKGQRRALSEAAVKQ